MRVLPLCAIAVAVVPSAAQAQRPDLSGTWTADRDRAPAALAPASSPVLGARFGLRIDAATVTLTRPAGGLATVSMLPLGGPPVLTPMPGPLCAGERILHEAASWEADALVLSVLKVTPAGGGTAVEANSRTLLRLEAPDRLVVEGTMVQRGERRQVVSVYVRTADSLPPPRPPLPVAGTPATVDQVAWIGGTWAGTAGSVTTEERWTPPASGGMMATARTLRGAALVDFEFLCIAERSGTLVYFAMPNARTPATPFVATAVTPTSVTFENPSHDYPTSIRYTRTAEGGLETTIAGPGGARSRTVALARAP